jgi:hypothetical protein
VRHAPGAAELGPNPLLGGESTASRLQFDFDNTPTTNVPNEVALPLDAVPNDLAPMQRASGADVAAEKTYLRTETRGGEKERVLGG